ncbi:hypothetical protein [Nocardia arthritidis]|uniref:Secreted protein n=1 Tax=Nocardia arthritidis TaxID=228602 RepID=A0A6G9YHF5_9NOCA|nr:hypothetical protein [Nocardia arthritidis]QIS12679.1 hypothetical protein F5544_24110 [Nocardia arthritidis]
MTVELLRRGLAVAACSVAALLPAMPNAAADIVGIIVYNTGSEGPVMGCPQTIMAGITNPADSRYEITDNGIQLQPVTLDANSDPQVLWTPGNVGWHAIEVRQFAPDGQVSVGRLDIEVHRVGINTGSACFVNGVPFLINPRTGSLFT